MMEARLKRSSPSSLNRLRRIDWLVLDVDGVLTAGGITYDDRGVELKTFHVRDGFGLTAWHRAGKHSALITGRSSNIVPIRARELGIRAVYQNAGDKLAALQLLQTEFGCSADQICSVGDDLPDMGVLAHCGVAVAVADAAPEIRRMADFVTSARGGCGAVREVIERLLKAQGRWQELIDQHRGQIR